MTYSNLASLQQQFINNKDLAFSENENGLIIIHIKNTLASASICLQGAHILSFQPNDQKPVIWLSEDAVIAPGKSIRGGVPICWPWFGAHTTDSSQPSHLNHEIRNEKPICSALFSLTPDEACQKPASG